MAPPTRVIGVIEMLVPPLEVGRLADRDLDTTLARLAGKSPAHDSHAEAPRRGAAPNERAPIILADMDQLKADLLGEYRRLVASGKPLVTSPSS